MYYLGYWSLLVIICQYFDYLTLLDHYLSLMVIFGPLILQDLTVAEIQCMYVGMYSMCVLPLGNTHIHTYIHTYIHKLTTITK